MGTTAECGVNTFMCFMAGQEGMMRDPELIETMEAVSEVGGLVMVHAENGDMIKEAERKMMIAGITGPEGHAMAHTTEAEVEGVMRACVLANQMSCPLFICSLSQGMAIDIVSSHHAAYNEQQRAQGLASFLAIPPGVTGLEERMMVLWQNAVKPGKMTRSQFVRATSATAAKLLNIFPQKGHIAEGSDADIVIWDPATNNTLTKEEQLSKCGFNIFEGMTMMGAPEYVIFKGKVIKDQDVFRPMTGYGQFQALPPFAPYLYDKIQENKEAGKIEPVIRNEEDMSDYNGFETIPPSTPEDKTYSNNQQRSSVDLNSPPQSPDFDEVNKSPSKSCVRVRAPPGGMTSGGFW